MNNKNDRNIGTIGYLSHTEGKIIAKVGNISQERATSLMSIDSAIAAYRPLMVFDPSQLHRLDLIARKDKAIREALIQNLARSEDPEPDCRWLLQSWSHFSAPGIGLVGLPVRNLTLIEKMDRRAHSDRGSIVTAQKFTHVAPMVIKERLTVLAILLSRLLGHSVSAVFGQIKVDSGDYRGGLSYRNVLTNLLSQVHATAVGPLLDNIGTKAAQMSTALVYLKTKMDDPKYYVCPENLPTMVNVCQKLSDVLQLELTVSGRVEDQFLRVLDNLAQTLKSIDLLSEQLTVAQNVSRTCMSRNIFFRSRVGDFSITGDCDYEPITYEKLEKGVRVGVTDIDLYVLKSLSVPVDVDNFKTDFLYTGSVDNTVVCIPTYHGMEEQYASISYQKAFATAMNILLNQLSHKAYAGSVEKLDEKGKVIGNDKTVPPEDRPLDLFGDAWDALGAADIDGLAFPVNAAISYDGVNLMQKGIVNWYNIQITEDPVHCIHKDAIVTLEDIETLSYTYPDTLHEMAGPWVVL